MRAVPIFGYGAVANGEEGEFAVNPPLLRLQCAAFGEELRGLLKSTKKGNPPGQRERKLSGIILSELDRLAQFRADGQPHPNEEKCKGKLAEITSLKLYRTGESIRIYFVVISQIIWMLLLDTDKRQTKISSGTEEKLLHRLKEVKELQRLREAQERKKEQ